MASAFLLVTGFWAQLTPRHRLAPLHTNKVPVAHSTKKGPDFPPAFSTPRLLPNQELLPAWMRDVPCSVPATGSWES